MRLFIAIQLSGEMKDALVSVQSSLRKAGVRGSCTKVENLHLTLAYIGEYPDPEFVLDAMRTVEFTPFSLSLDGFGTFGDLYWIGVGGSDALTACAKRLRRALAGWNIPFDRKRFSPHITLIRRVTMESGSRLAGVRIPESSMMVRHLSLMRSDRGKNGMIYTELGQVPAVETEGNPF